MLYPARRITMTKPSPLGSYVRRFLLEYLISDRGLSRNTQKGYRDVFRLLLRFLESHYQADVTQITVEQITPEVVRAFLKHLEKDHGNAAATRNHRLAVIHSFLRFAAGHAPELLDLATQVRAIPLRRVPSQPMPYLEKAEMDALLAVPNRDHAQGRRDYAILLFLYNTGARAQEAADVRIGDLIPGSSVCVRIHGKGNRTRICPLWPHTATILQALLAERHDFASQAPLFVNVRGAPMTRFGIHTLVERVVLRATTTLPSLATKRISPHAIRRTAAVHLLRSGVDINTIRAWLGHVSVETTNRYAEVDLEMKAKAIAMCAVTPNEEGTCQGPRWRKDPDLMAFLDSL
jgi:integrase/recombinase XerD